MKLGCEREMMGALIVWASIMTPVGLVMSGVLVFEIDRLGGKEMKIVRRMCWSIARFFLPLGSSW